MDTEDSEGRETPDADTPRRDPSYRPPRTYRRAGAGSARHGIPTKRPQLLLATTHKTPREHGAKRAPRQWKIWRVPYAVPRGTLTKTARIKLAVHVAA